MKFLTMLMTALILSVFSGTAVYTVDGSSMEPALHAGERIKVDKRYYKNHDVRRGDLILFQAEGKSYIKRVIGLPGERVEIRGGTVWIDGKVLEEPYLGAQARETDEAENTDDPSGKSSTGTAGYYVLGDNRMDSLDSRMIGRIADEAIRGKVTGGSLH
ncbi:signal peptidase I [Paenibacillus glufosinatiresistens]|uniref:signal peptidase I n=1 Tax=Paenibacillus glufosinatiresistens TaxID=3070657 RepID=UPI00286E4B86|nr:signal peptidase I [Paenibacillus sp. YX.27]